jgi:hypothetical protein
VVVTFPGSIQRFAASPFAPFAKAIRSLFPDLAVQAGQTTVLTSPGIVEVYVDSSTQLLNTAPLALGSLLRFNGVLFNNIGTLRLDCGEVNDGTAE